MHLTGDGTREFLRNYEEQFREQPSAGETQICAQELLEFCTSLPWPLPGERKAVLERRYFDRYVLSETRPHESTQLQLIGNLGEQSVDLSHDPWIGGGLAVELHADVEFEVVAYRGLHQFGYLIRQVLDSVCEQSGFRHQ